MKMVNKTDTYGILKQRISKYASKYKRNSENITLIGASKTQNSSVIRQFFNNGLTNFGENYLNEALQKKPELTNLSICWHYIGSIQSNKTKPIAEHFNWVHTIDRIKIARRLNQHVNELKKENLNVLIQVNLDDESSKSGVAPANVLELSAAILELQHLNLRGLMSIPKARNTYIEQLETHKRLISLKEDINQSLNINLDTISAGMSGDMEAAIAAGSTMVRVGTDLFGKRA